MRKPEKNQAKKILLLASCLMLSLSVFAQVGPPDDDVDDIPIDGGLSLVVAGGIAYGAKVINSRKKRNEKANID